MPEWLIGAIAGGGSGLLGVGIAWGTISNRVGRLEKDIEARVMTSLFEAHLRRIEDKLDRLLEEREREITGTHRLRPEKG